jgi:hypothetical protein
VYPWYVLHQTLIIAGIGLLAPLGLGPVLEPMLLVALTIAGCWVLTDGVIRRLDWVRPLFGLKPRRTRGKTKITLAAQPLPPEQEWRSPSPRA